jgi:hypothetical protein
MLFYNIYIISSFDFATFNWYAGSIYYIIPPFVLTLFYLVNTKKFDYRTNLKLFIIAIFIGGIHEAYSMIVIAMLIANIIVLYFKNGKTIFSGFEIRKILIALFVISVCLAVVIIALEIMLE